MKIKYPYGKIYCRILNKTIRIGKDAYPDKNSGWLCDCGNWTKENLKTHDVYDKPNRRFEDGKSDDFPNRRNTL